MSQRLFREGGPHNVRYTDSDQFTMEVSLPPDNDGLVGRDCTVEGCSPGYFKVKPGTGITQGLKIAFCPYCRHGGEPSSFITKEQLRYAEDLLVREAHGAFNNLFEDALGLGSSRKKTIGGGFLKMEMSFTPSSLPHVRHPIEEELRRDITCIQCGLEHAVFGLAFWCPDCGQDIFLTHVNKEYDVIKHILGDVNRRLEMFGPRVAARDIENALEDTVSLFEAVLRALVRRHMNHAGMFEADIDVVFNKKIRNGFQNILRAAEICYDLFNVKLLDVLSETEKVKLCHTFEKRHPITHNLGIVDRKFMDKARAGAIEGRDVRVSRDEIENAMILSSKVISNLHSLFTHD